MTELDQNKLVEGLTVHQLVKLLTVHSLCKIVLYKLKKPKPNLKLAQKKTDIVLIGAYGYTGKLICNYFQDNQISINIAGRDESKLQEIQKIQLCFRNNN